MHLLTLHKFEDKSPRVDSEAYVSERASVIGDVEIGPESSIWEFAVLRADMNKITIGRGTSIQDNATVHTEFTHPTRMGDYVTAGHNCVIHGCEIGDRCVIGIGSVVLTGAKIGNDCVIGAGAVVTEGSEIPPNSLVLGVPGKVVREVPDGLKQAFMMGARSYIELARAYREQSD